MRMCMWVSGVVSMGGRIKSGPAECWWWFSANLHMPIQHNHTLWAYLWTMNNEHLYFLYTEGGVLGPGLIVSSLSFEVFSVISTNKKIEIFLLRSRANRASLCSVRPKKGNENGNGTCCSEPLLAKIWIYNGIWYKKVRIFLSSWPKDCWPTIPVLLGMWTYFFTNTRLWGLVLKFC